MKATRRGIGALLLAATIILGFTTPASAHNADVRNSTTSEKCVWLYVNSSESRPLCPGNTSYNIADYLYVPLYTIAYVYRCNSGAGGCTYLGVFGAGRVIHLDLDKFYVIYAYRR